MVRKRQMTAEEYLSQYHYNELEIARVKDVVIEKRRLAYDLQGIAYDSTKVQGGGKNSTEEKIHRFLIASERYEKQIDDMLEQQKEIEDNINRIADVKERQILRYKYLSGLTLAVIAYMIGYSEVHTCRLHKKALDEFQSIIDC